MAEQVTTIEEFTALITEWYNTDDRGFKTYFDASLENVKPVPDATDEELQDGLNPDHPYYDWTGKTITDLCTFFEAWYAWMPDVATGLNFIQKFSWLYYKNEYGLAFVTKGAGYEMTKQFVFLRGAYFDSTESTSKIDDWITQLGGIDEVMKDYIIPEPTNTDTYGFASFNEFFARVLQPGARPIASPEEDSVAVAPTDSLINMIVDDLTLETKIPVKTTYLNVMQLLNNSEYAARFDKGTAVSCILMPDTYHHYHAPVAGTVIESNENVEGQYFGISDFPGLINDDNVGYGYNYSVFEDFRRGYLIIDTTKYGLVALIPVGLNTISSVIFEDKFKNLPSGSSVAITKGERVGKFLYGGSLNILLFQEGCFPAQNIPQGQQIGLLFEPESPAAKVRLTRVKNNRFYNRIAYLAK
ncbi:MAG: phosphatidylserine decarboxylase [Symploca sp. SIO2E9]|nr:phosphatidylserine decarboxylase [Symploca sp. SIO2E9]